MPPLPGKFFLCFFCRAGQTIPRENVCRPRQDPYSALRSKKDAFSKNFEWERHPRPLPCRQALRRPAAMSAPRFSPERWRLGTSGYPRFLIETPGPHPRPFPLSSPSAPRMDADSRREAGAVRRPGLLCSATAPRSSSAFAGSFARRGDHWSPASTVFPSIAEFRKKCNTEAPLTPPALLTRRGAADPCAGGYRARQGT